MATILPASERWAYPDMATDYRVQTKIWREVDKTFYTEALSVLPPIYCADGFLVGEAYDHTETEAIYAAFWQDRSTGRCFARYSSIHQMPQDVRELQGALLCHVP